MRRPDAFKKGDKVRVIGMLFRNSGQKDPVGLTGTVAPILVPGRELIHVRLDLPESVDPRVYPDLFFEEELELVQPALDSSENEEDK